MIQFKNVSKVYQARRGQVKALDNFSIDIAEGSFTVLRGASGSGKTTMLMLAGGMQRPDTGSVIVDDKDLYAMSAHQRANFRANNIGFIFQMFHLIPYLNVLENVIMARGNVANNTKITNSRLSHKENVKQATELLAQLDLSHRLHHRPAELSAGEKQRVAIARAMLNHPKIILADEPTGNLDPENEKQVLDYLKEYNRQGTTIVLVTHGSQADKYADNILQLRDGKLINETAVV